MSTLKCITDRQTATGRAVAESRSARNWDKHDVAIAVDGPR